MEHCAHCFTPLPDLKHRFCARCRRGLPLTVARAFAFDPQAPLLALCACAPEELAGFVAYQWVQLDWPIPDAILSLPDTASFRLSKAVSHLLCRPWIEVREIKSPGLELLIVDAISPFDHIRRGVRPVLETSPKSIYQLSLAPYGFRNYLD